MGARLTFGLVVLAAATLAAGYFSHTAWLIFISIACSVGAALGLWAGSRRRRRKGHAETDATLAWTASLAEPELTAAISVVPRSRATADDSFADTEISRRPPRPSRGRTGPAAVGAGVGAGVGVEATARRGASNPASKGRAAPLVRSAAIGGDTDADGRFDAVAVTQVQPRPTQARPSAPRPSTARATAPTARPTPHAVPAAPAPAPVRAPAPAPARAPATAPARAPAAAEAASPARAASPAGTSPAGAPARRRPPVEEFPFPIEDYDYLDVEDIVPLLPELDDQELVEVLLREHEGANRRAIMERIDALLEGDE